MLIKIKLKMKFYNNLVRKNLEKAFKNKNKID